MDRTLEEKWQKLNEKTKKVYMFVTLPLLRVCPILSLLIIINDIIASKHLFDYEYFVLVVVIKFIVAYSLGVLIGWLDWEFNARVMGNKFAKISGIRNTYIFLNGVLLIGGTLMIYEFTYPYPLDFDPIMLLLKTAVIGMTFAWGAWSSFAMDVRQYGNFNK